MKLPHRRNAVIRRGKSINYLLSLIHEDGKSKAKFFREIGFNETNIDEFEQALLKIGQSNAVDSVDKEKSRYVIKYVIFGLIASPNGRQYQVKTVWAIEAGSKIPHLVTALPGV